MKKTFFLFFFLCCIILQGQAQDKFGLKAGLNLATVNNTINEGPQTKLAPHVGFYLESRTGKVLSLQPEVMYSAKGYKRTFYDGDYAGKVDLHYVNVAFLFKFYLVKGFNLSIGPQAGVLVSSKTTTVVGTYTGTTTTITENGKDDYELFEASANIGMGYQFENGFNLGLRYDKGLSHILANDPYKDTRRRDNIGKMTNETIQFFVAYSF